LKKWNRRYQLDKRRVGKNNARLEKPEGYMTVEWEKCEQEECEVCEDKSDECWHYQNTAGNQR